MANFLSPEWFEQAGKDIVQGGQDFGEDLQDGAQVVGDALPGVAQVVGDVAQVVGETVQNVAQVIGDVVTDVGEALPDVPVNPNPNSVVDQIENNVDQQPTSGYVVDQIESTIVQLPTSDYIVDQIESTNNLQSTPDYVVGPDFNNSAPELLSPVFETFDPLTNPNPGLEVRAFEYGEVGVDVLSIDTINDEESYRRALELLVEWRIRGGGGGYGYMEALRQQSIEYLLNERLQEAMAENPTF